MVKGELGHEITRLEVLEKGQGVLEHPPDQMDMDRISEFLRRPKHCVFLNDPDEFRQNENGQKEAREKIEL